MIIWFNPADPFFHVSLDRYLVQLCEIGQLSLADLGQIRNYFISKDIVKDTLDVIVSPTSHICYHPQMDVNPLTSRRVFYTFEEVLYLLRLEGEIQITDVFHIIDEFTRLGLQHVLSWQMIFN